MHNRALRWIDLHEDHVRNRLSEVDPILGSMAASSPSGENDDPEVHAWESQTGGRYSLSSLVEFRRHADFTRDRLKHFLGSIELLLRTPATQSSALDVLVPALAFTFSEFCALRGCRFAWQDIQAEDAGLISRIETVFFKLGEKRVRENYRSPF